MQPRSFARSYCNTIKYNQLNYSLKAAQTRSGDYSKDKEEEQERKKRKIETDNYERQFS